MIIHQKMIKPACALILLFLLSGCTGLARAPIEKNYYDLAIRYSINSDPAMCQGENLLVREFHIASAFDSHSFILRVKNDEYINDYYNEFVSYPAKLITEKFSDHLYATPYFSSTQTATQQDVDYRLSGKITKLYGDFQTKALPKAIIELRLILEKKSKKKFAVVISKTYKSVIPIEYRNPTDLVSGWSKGLSTIITEFLTDFNQASE